MEKKQFLEAGEIVNTHGVRGEIKILPWTDSAEFLRGFKTLYIDEKAYRVVSSRVHKGCLIAALEGVDDINAAMTLKGRMIYFDRRDAKL
ncbi:MAG: 16S rRNA processing protein RimM, partial [Ruminococcaceae bacterium]|nr:16S rRNA processing protein RimM [Oscillospiraceae bacterium]